MPKVEIRAPRARPLSSQVTTTSPDRTSAAMLSPFGPFRTGDRYGLSGSKRPSDGLEENRYLDSDDIVDTDGLLQPEATTLREIRVLR